MDGKPKDLADQKVLNLAAEVSNARDTQIPRLLLKIQSILDSHKAGSASLAAVKKDIWHYDLLHVLVPTLKQDFSKLPQGWYTASKLADILSHCCVGLDPGPKEEQMFNDEFLPDATDHLLTLARRLQNKYIKTADVLDDTKKDLLDNMKSVLQAVSYLCGGYDSQAIYVFKSPWLLKLIMEEEANTCAVALTTVQSINRIKRGLCGEVEEQVVHAILDELIYKLSASEDTYLASTSIRTLLGICDSHPPVVELLCSRYRGLKSLLNKWTGKGFGSDLRRLQLLLDAGSMQKAEQERLNQAARTVQAMWRSYATRKKIKKAGRAIATFQRSFRKRREIEEEHKRNEKERKELELFVLKQRKKAMRGLHFKQLETLEILPASAVSKHLSNEQTRAALKIQARWRGHWARSSINERRRNVQRVRAAVTVQRAVRAWLDRVRAARREPPGWQRPPGLTDERRVELQNRIHEHRLNHPAAERSREQMLELHDRVQNLLRLHVTSAKQRRKHEQHREALLARLELDSQLLLSAPSLADADNVDVSGFVCHSVPIATKARQNHSEELRLLRQPWWKKLGDEYQDAKYEEEQAHWKVF